jgi:hypothetical protein
MFCNSSSTGNSGFFPKKEDENKVLYSFEGIMEHRTIGYLLTNAIKELDYIGISLAIQKKAFRIMMESLENIQKHSGYTSGSHSYSKFVLLNNKSELIFNTSNSVFNSNKIILQEKIEEINQLDIEKWLNSKYRMIIKL